MKSLNHKSTIQRKEWKDMSAKEKRESIIVLITVVVFILFWISSDFRSALAMVLLGYVIYFIIKAVRNKKTRKESTVAAVILFFVMAIAIPPIDDSKVTSNSTAEITEKSDKKIAELAEQKNLAEAKKLKQEQEARDARVAAAQQENPTGDLYKVTSITDGDTIKVSINGTTETIRFIGMDTPETKDPRKPVQCFGKEATSKMQSYVQSKSVRLAKDSSQNERDKYGRLLRYVFLEDGRNVAHEMIKEGYAHEYTYASPYQYQAQFKAAEKIARDTSVGLWSLKTCNGDTDQRLPVKPSPTPAPAPAPAPVPTPTPAPAPQSSVYYKNCTAARAAGAAPVYVGHPGYGTHLDRDRDGIGCE